MTAYELSIGAVCAIVGYIAISVLWPKSWTQKDDANPRTDRGEGPSGPFGNSRQKPDIAMAGAAQAPWHDVLEVAPTATLEEIRQAYREKIAKYHPDKVAHLGPELQEVATRMSATINQAYREGCEHRGA